MLKNKSMWVTVLTQVSVTPQQQLWSGAVGYCASPYTSWRWPCAGWVRQSHTATAPGSSRVSTLPKNQSRERILSPTPRLESQSSIQLYHSYNHYMFSLMVKAKLWNLSALRGNYFLQKIFVETDNSARWPKKVTQLFQVEVSTSSSLTIQYFYFTVDCSFCNYVRSSFSQNKISYLIKVKRDLDATYLNYLSEHSSNLILF